jgi:hypothetical protein
MESPGWKKINEFVFFLQGFPSILSYPSIEVLRNPVDPVYPV